MTRAWAFLVFALVLAAAAFQLATIRTDIGDFFFSGDADNPGFRIGRIQTEELARRYLISVGHTGIDELTRREFVVALQQTLTESKQVRRIWTEPFTHRDIQHLLQFYAPYQLLLLSLQPEREVSGLLSPQGMASQAAMIREALLGPGPSLVKSLLVDDPMLLTLSWFTRIGQTSSQPESDPAHSAFFLETQHPGLDTTAQQRFQQTLTETFGALNRNYDQRFTLEYTGVPVFAVSIREQVSRDITRISTLSIGVVILLSWLVFRSLRTLLCISIMLFTTACIATLLVQWVYGYLHGLTLALGTTLIGICVDYFIHAMVHTGDNTGAERVQAIRRLWPVLLVGGATTLIGYTALSFSGFPGLQQVAMFTGSGIVAALLITRYLLPDLMGLFQVQVQPHIDLSWLLTASAGTRPRYLVIAIITGCLLAGGARIHWGDDLGTLAPSLQQLAKTDRLIRARLSSIEPGRFILVTGNSMESVLHTAEQVQRQLVDLQRQGKLDAYYPLFPWIASSQLQTHNAQAWNDALNPAARERWTQTLADHGLSTAAFPPLTAAPKPLLEPELALGSPAAILLSTQLLQDTNGTTAVIWLGKHQPQALVEALQTISGARYFSQKDNIRQLARDYRNKAQTMLVWGILLILALLSLRYRSALGALRVLSPAALSIMLLLGLWGLSGTPMGMLHLIGLLLTAAVCVDYGVFFMENRGGNRKRTFQAITVSAITTAAAFASLGIAENPALHALAWTVAPGVLAGFMLCPVMLGHTGNGE
ncbi:MAG: MMPL family transporter [Gammaproteobacteria bacterium]|nr:MMPL family transporter [Gammaproteobacteria bacterium]